jgi:hypothetical protein
MNFCAHLNFKSINIYRAKLFSKKALCRKENTVPMPSTPLLQVLLLYTHTLNRIFVFLCWASCFVMTVGIWIITKMN